MAEIVVYKGGQEVSRKKLSGGEVKVGRDPSSDIVLDDPRVSRLHARIVPEGAGFLIEDKSTHGTFVGEARIGRHTLKDGDRVQIADRTLAFVAQDGTKPPIAPISGVAPMQGPAPGAGAGPGDKPAGEWEQFQTVFMQGGGGGQESAARLKALFEMSVALETAKDFPAILRALLDRAITIMGAERGFIMLKDADTGKLSVHVARDRAGDISGVEAESTSRSLMEKVVNSGAPVLIRNAMGGEWGTESMLANKIHSALCVPLRTQEDVSGVLYVDHRSRLSAFTDQDLTFFTIFALQAKAAIDSSRAYWELVESLFRASGDFIAVCGTDGKIRQVNRGAQKMTGLSEAELLARRIPEVALPSDKAQAETLCRETLEKGVVSSTDITFVGADGRHVPMSASTFVMRGRDGKPMGFCLIGRDLTELKNLIERLTSANVKLRELNDMKSQFVGMISHELKTPLSVVVGYAEMMLEDPKDTPSDRQKDYLTRILRSGDKLIGLIMELLELTRIETGKMPLKPVTLEVKTMLAEIVDNFTLQAQEKKVAVSVQIADGITTMEGDKDLLRRALDNFVSNGIKYNREGRTLKVSVERVGPALVFSFADEGIGISKEDQEKLFGRFFRASNVGAIPGTGLGLSIVKAIIERHDGRIAIESEIDKGTTFKITLPLKCPAVE
jgi:PAS domain S-box-containing protein